MRQQKHIGPQMNTDMNRLLSRCLWQSLKIRILVGMYFLRRSTSALLMELRLRGIKAATQSFPVMYKGECVGEYFADFLIEDILVVELKCVDSLTQQT